MERMMMMLNETFSDFLQNDDNPLADGDPVLDGHFPEDGQNSLVQQSKFYIAIALSVCCCVGFFGNTMSALIFLHDDMRSPINFLLAAVSIIDLSLMLLIIPVLILPGLNTVLKSDFLDTCYTGSILYVYPIGVMARTASMWTYVMVAIERYIAVCQPLKSYKLMTNRQAKFALTCIVSTAIAYNMVRFWEYRWNHKDGVLESLLHRNYFYFIFYYTTLHLITHYLLPISVILILHASIVLNLKHANEGRLNLRCANGALISSERRQKSTTLMIVVATLIFVACNFLSFLVNLWEVIDPNGMEDERWSTFVHVMTDLANVLLALHSACSFLIYMKFCRQYRQLFCKLCKFSSCRQRERSVDTKTNSSLLKNRRRKWRHLRKATAGRSAVDAFQMSDLNEANSSDIVITSFRARNYSDLICLRQGSNATRVTNVSGT